MEEEDPYKEEKRKKKEKGLRFPMFRRSEVVSPRTKDGLLNES